jgi:hypothetical protein
VPYVVVTQKVGEGDSRLVRREIIGIRRRHQASRSDVVHPTRAVDVEDLELDVSM